MKGYLVANITVTDPERYKPYREQMPDIIARFGGRFLVRGGAVHPLEGELGFDRFVVAEFPSIEALRRFYDSPEYAPLLKLRLETTQFRVALVEGCSPE